MGNLVRNLKGMHDPTDVLWIADKLESMYLSEARVGYVKKQTFSPSTLVFGQGACPVYWWYAFEGGEWRRTNSAKDIATMSYGTNRHGVLQQAFESFPEFVQNELEVLHDDPPIRGFCDVVLERDGHRILGEIKTTRHESWLKRQISGPPKYNLMQLAVYMYVEQVQSGFMLYESANTKQLLIFPVELDDALKSDVEQMFDWMRTTRAAWEQQTKPARPFVTPSRECKSCPVSKQCWDDKDGDVQIGKMPVELM